MSLYLLMWLREWRQLPPELDEDSFPCPSGGAE